MRRDLFTEDHEAFRELARDFIEKEVVPAYPEWENRKAFGTPVASFQNTKFELAACSTEVEAGQAMLDRAVALHVEGELSAPDAARVKLFCTEMQARVVDRCLQLFGGYGYMMEYPIARLYTDARVARIYAGTSEVMKVIIAKSLGL
jgi:acyl-CoA dehydrogenase